MLYNSAAHHSFLWQQRFLGPWNSFTHAAIFKSTEFGPVSPEVEELLGLHVHVCQVLHVCYKSISTLWEPEVEELYMVNVMSYVINRSVLYWEPKSPITCTIGRLLELLSIWWIMIAYSIGFSKFCERNLTNKVKANSCLWRVITYL